ncbi:sporulation membrane protein YtaF [Sporanaerobacter acetigenes]|uniref:Putative sporulation protein YtaF n=1 Tax=Sporanaerobacter acetigenes DSM 13106 TaxID=1123281 RepID=A0A1M5YU67_9FIRM|nr:sporulation membrane protein YtaF [Sporanaerobacter acetigenes]SHI15364.1 putative sporulation protein YtaF [Sporanaerobacter acetigenes DSM 13106]
MLESLFIVVAICIDSLAIGIAYGMKKIKIPIKSLFMINIICTGILAIAMFLGDVAKKFLPGQLPTIISFLILLFIGIYFLVEGLINFFANKSKESKKKFEIKFSNVKIIIDVVVDCTKADMNQSGDIDLKEAFYLGMALSLDALGIGFGSALGNINYIQVLVLSFIFNMAIILIGLFLGEKIVSKSKMEFSWISGLILIFLALCKLKA